MQYLIHLKKAHKAEVDEVLSTDPLLEKELEFDLKRYSKEEENRNKGGLGMGSLFFANYNLSGGNASPNHSVSDHVQGTPGMVSKGKSPPMSRSRLMSTPTLKESKSLGQQDGMQLRDMDLNSPQYKRAKPEESATGGLGSEGGSRLSEEYLLPEGSKRKRGARMGAESLSSLSSKLP